jgi:hypothetical protein
MATPYRRIRVRPRAAARTQNGCSTGTSSTLTTSTTRVNGTPTFTKSPKL